MKQKPDSFVNQWHSVYFMVPLFEHPVTFPPLETICQALSQKLGKVTPLGEDAKLPQKPEELLSFVLWDHLATYESDQKKLPAQLMLYGADSFDQTQWDEFTIANFWACPDKETFLPRCRYSFLASNFLSAGLPLLEQYGILATYADVLLSLFPDCIGIYWPHSQNLVTRDWFLDSGWQDPRFHFLDGGLNLCFFRVMDTEEFIFDTLGFTAIGLTDLQCHCKDLSPDDVALYMRNVAAYLFQAGNVIEDGHTLEGIDHEKWRCRLENALIGPERPVIDIHPGKYAGGNRD